MRTKWTAFAGGMAALALPLVAAVPAVAQTQGDGSGTQTYKAAIGALNGSGASGTVTITFEPSTNQATVEVDASGVVPGLPHAQHLHFGPDAAHTCPDPSVADSEAGNDVNTNPDVIASVEARPAYGPVDISLTTKGDTSPSSALAVKRFPTAPEGTIDYQRTITLTDQQARYLTSGTFVYAAHGIDTVVQDGKYSPDSGTSPLAVAAFGQEEGSAIPLEATAPFGCGVVTATQAGGVPAKGDMGQVEKAPQGGVETGDAPTGGDNLGLLALGGTALVGAGVTLAVARRKSRGQA